MKILLIQPGCAAALKKENLGLAYLAAALESDGHRVQVVDEVVGQIVRDTVSAFKPDLIGISCMTMHANRAYAIADDLRRRGYPVMLGGAHPSALPDEALQHADAVICGEAERSLPRALVSGLVEGIIAVDPPEDLDALPMPDRSKLDLHFYASEGEQLAGVSRRTLGVITSRGCPYKCIFCINSKRATDVRFHNPARVLEELKDLVKRYAIESVAFYDELIASDPARFLAICEGMVRENLHHLQWECQMHPRFIKPALLEAMKCAGCIQVAIGFESGSQRILDTIGKNTTVEGNIEAARRVREAGLRVRGCFVVGTPGETLEDIAQTEAFIQAARIDFASVHFLTPMPGTALFDAHADAIAAAGLSWEHFTAGDPDTFQCNTAIPPAVQKQTFLRLSARLAFRNYTWREMLLKALREPRRALHVAARRIFG